MKAYKNRELTRKVNWHKLATMSKEEVLRIQEEWESVKKENEKLRMENIELKNNALKEIKDVLTKYNITIEKYSKANIFKSLGYTAWFKKNIYTPISNKYNTYPNSIPTMDVGSYEKDGIKLNINGSPFSIVEGHKRLSADYERAKIKELQKNKLFKASIVYAIENNINTDDLDDQSIIRYVNDHAKEKWTEENYPDGTELYLKHACYECSTWIVGERRCSCGNRRIYLEVDGNILDGFDAYPEPY